MDPLSSNTDTQKLSLQTTEPSTTSDNKEERILARRQRIQTKMESDRRAALGEESPKEEKVIIDPEKQRHSYRQTLTSELRLEKLLIDGTQLVTNVSIAGDSKEVTRRQEEMDSRRERYDKLEAEVIASAERFEEISKKWLKSKGLIIPDNLQSLLQDQMATTSAMIDEKDKLINDLQQDLKAKDDQYVKHLRKQAEDVDLILERMEEQAKTLMKAYREEMNVIETSFSTERRNLLETQQAEWDSATSKRSAKECEFLEAREKRIEENEAQIQHLRVRNSEDFNQVKKKLELDIQILQQQIQQMKSTFQLNAEKLEYNFQVLKKRDEENTVTISQQKRRLTRQQDTLNNLRTKVSKQEKACQAELDTVMEAHRKNIEQYREQQKKMKLSQLTDRKRFYDIWCMNEETVRVLNRDVTNADKIIYEQQLGLKWEPQPDIETPIKKDSMKVDKETNGATLLASQIMIISESNADPALEIYITPPSAGDGDGQSTVIHYPPAVIKPVLELLCAESGFLIESKLASLLAPLEKEEQMLMRLDSVFNAIGVETEEDLHHLVSYFIEKKADVDDPELPEGQALDSAVSERIRIPSLIHPNKVPTALHAFVQQRHGSAKASSLSSRASTVTQNKDYAELLDGQFWDKMTQVVPERHERVWTALLQGLQRYHSTLQARTTLIGETDHLRLQNGELRMLLHQYMSARINHELEIPPTLTMPTS